MPVPAPVAKMKTNPTYLETLQITNYNPEMLPRTLITHVFIALRLCVNLPLPMLPTFVMQSAIRVYHIN